MKTVLLGYKRRMLPIPQALFRAAMKAGARKTFRHLGGLDTEHRRVHHFVVRELPSLAKPMAPEFIVDGLQVPLERVVQILDELERRMIFLFRPGGRDVVWAYPVTVEKTPHFLSFSSGERLNAA